MAYEVEYEGHVYFYEVDYGEELGVARIVIRSDSKNAGLFFVKPNGMFDPAVDTPGFGVNTLAQDGVWPDPPREAIEDVVKIARQKPAVE